MTQMTLPSVPSHIHRTPTTKPMLTRRFHLPAALLLLIASAALGHADPTVFNQAPSDPSTQEFYTWASCADADDNPINPGYDNFSPAAASYVTAVQWRGNYIAYPDVPNNNPVGPDTTAFTISFLADDNGSPGAVLATNTVDNSACDPQSLGTLSGFEYEGGGTPYTITYYSYRAVLPTPFAVAAGQKYWISIVGVLSSDTVFWGWYSSGGANDGNSLQDVGTGTLVSRQFNRDFTLEGVPSAFLVGDAPLGDGVYYLAFPNGNLFGYYEFLSDPNYIYHYDLGFEYIFDANDGQGGVYFYDFTSSDYFYTSPTFAFPYLYDFGLNAFLYYYPDTASPGHYTSNPRYFYNFSTQQIITK